MTQTLLLLVPIIGLLTLGYTYIQYRGVSKQDAGNDRMQEIAKYISEGAMAFLKAEYKVLAYFVVIVALLLAVMSSSNEKSSPLIAVAFIVGAVFSALAGFVGMRVATKANVRTAEAARTSLSKALKVSFTGGSVMGLGVAGLAVFGLGSVFIMLRYIFAAETPDSIVMERTRDVLTGFSRALLYLRELEAEFIPKQLTLGQI